MGWHSRFVSQHRAIEGSAKEPGSGRRRVRNGCVWCADAVEIFDAEEFQAVFGFSIEQDFRLEQVDLAVHDALRINVVEAHSAESRIRNAMLGSDKSVGQCNVDITVL